MVPNVLADVPSHRARFVWLSLALAATLTLFLAALPSPERAAPPQRSLRWQHGCTAHRFPADLEVEHRALRDAARAEHRALRDAARAEHRALRDAARTERDAERAARRARFTFYY